jgi:hypothetical protein
MRSFTVDERTALVEAAEALLVLDVGITSWRTMAARRLCEIASSDVLCRSKHDSPLVLGPRDFDLLIHASLELIAEEDHGALSRDRVTFRSVVADELALLAGRLRGATA